MLHIGCHLSSSNGYQAMGQESVGLGATTFAFFTRNPRGGAAKAIDPADAAAFTAFAAAHGFAKLVAHAPYTMNPCSADPGLRDFARNMMLDDMTRMEYTPGNLYNFHPGSHVQQGAEAGIAFTAQMLASVLKTAAEKKQSTTLLLETMAGKGSEIGRTFEEIHEIISKTEELLGAETTARFGKPETAADGTPVPASQSSACSDEGRSAYKLGVCLDTCHIWDGGYGIASDLDGVISRFDRSIGLDRLCAVHLNDSMNDLNTHKDRHEKIGEGKIGLEALVHVINHPALHTLPFILETPNDTAGYAAEIALLKSRYSY